jgi:putative oxidoreductase
MASITCLAVTEAFFVGIRTIDYGADGCQDIFSIVPVLPVCEIRSGMLPIRMLRTKNHASRRECLSMLCYTVLRSYKGSSASTLAAVKEENGMISTAYLKKCSEHLSSLMRIVFALLFMQHGGQKLFDFPVAKGGAPLELWSLMGVAGVLELFGGLLLLLGLFTRPIAFLLAGEMAVAYFRAHLPNGFWPIANRGELAVLYCFAFLYLAAAGGGPWSLDRFCRKR